PALTEVRSLTSPGRSPCSAHCGCHTSRWGWLSNREHAEGHFRLRRRMMRISSMVVTSAMGVLFLGCSHRDEPAASPQTQQGEVRGEEGRQEEEWRQQ